MLEQLILLKNVRNCLTTAASVKPVFQKGPMLAHQYSLPKLPVPSLHSTLDKYLLSVQPLLTEKEFSQTKMVVEEFRKPGGIGEELHNILLKRARHTENWLADWWLYTAYLGYRMPVVVYTTAAVVFPLQQFFSQKDQLKFSATMIAAALEFKTKIESQTIPPDKLHGDPLDMMQYFRMFSCCRIPEIPVDRQEIPSLDSKSPTHIVVAHNNQFFRINVYGADGLPLDAIQLLDQLHIVVEQSQHEVDPIGLLTTQHRDIWAKAYSRLCKERNNEELLRTIHQSIFLLCLDKPLIGFDKGNRETHAGYQVIHGGGKYGNSGNRWFDKTLQFVVSEDGVAGLLMEHSPIDGPPLNSLIKYIMNYSEKKSQYQWKSVKVLEPPQSLQFVFSSETKKDIYEAEQQLQKIVDNLDLSSFKYRQYGSNFVKSHQMSPDSYFQMALQLTSFRLHNHLLATYESGSTRKFLQGRTETIRSASLEALDFCRKMMSKEVTTEEKKAALFAAINSHKEYTIQASNGFGVDRLLLGLRRAAEEKGMDLPNFFSDEGYTKSTCFRLSTSQVGSEYDTYTFFGPTQPNGYGCCYNPHKSEFIYTVSAFNDCPETNSCKFVEALNVSLTEMQNLFL